MTGPRSAWPSCRGATRQEALGGEGIRGGSWLERAVAVGVVASGRAGRAGVGLARCSDRPALAQDDENDPLEPVNRAVFQVNHFLDRLLLKPIAILYRDATPQFVRDGVTNFLANLQHPGGAGQRPAAGRRQAEPS